MRELKFKEVDKNIYKISDVSGNILIKPFYTIEEMGNIYNDMAYSFIFDEDGNKVLNEKKEPCLKSKDVLNEYFAKVVLTVKFCTNIDTEEMTDDEIFNVCLELGLDTTFKTNINQYLELDYMMKREKSTERIIEDFLDIVTEKINKTDTEGLVKKLQVTIKGAMNK
jgi:hypothetical protein